MKKLLPVTALLLLWSVTVRDAAASPEGLTLTERGEAVVFRVERTDAASVRVQVFDHETDTVLFDSGWNPLGPLEWSPSAEIESPWRYRVEARNAGGALILSHTGIREAGLIRAVPGETSHGPSVMNIGSAQSSGSLRTFLEGSTVAVSQLGSTPGGGRFRLLDEEGFTTALIEPDTHGTGIFMSLARDQGHAGLLFDGNKNGSGEPLMALTGSERSAVFDMSATGNQSVQLPERSISALEMFNEPGVASVNATNAVTSGTELLERSIVAPSSGYVLAIGTVQMNMLHLEGTVESYTVGIALNGTTIAAEQDFDTSISSTIEGAQQTFIFSQVVTVHGLFAVDPGMNTIRLLADGLGGNVSASERQLSILFAPTNYGLVSLIAPTEAASAERGIHGSESLGTPEEAAALALAEDRLGQELRAMEERLARLERLLRGQDVLPP